MNTNQTQTNKNAEITGEIFMKLYCNICKLEQEFFADEDKDPYCSNCGYYDQEIWMTLPDWIQWDKEKGHYVLLSQVFVQDVD